MIATNVAGIVFLAALPVYAAGWWIIIGARWNRRVRDARANLEPNDPQPDWSWPSGCGVRTYHFGPPRNRDEHHG